MEKKKFSIKLNNVDKIEQLLQETYDLACQQSRQIQDEINKISNTTVIKSLDIDGKEKYAKIMNNYMALLQKSTTQKFDIAKLMAEVVKHNGDINGALNDSKNNSSTLDLKKLRDLARSVATTSNEKELYTLKK